MTLTRQLLLSGMFLLLSIFSGMLYYVIDNTQTFVDHQLGKHAKDTATSLGLSLSLAMEGNEIDIPTANRIVDAVWDSGYYKKIMVVNLKGKAEIERQLEIQVYQVPNWFINYIEVRTKEERAKIQSGWLQQGEVIVQSNPGFAYQQLWTTFIDALQWFVITAVIAAVLGGFLLFIILKPLRAVTRQATAICNQQFVEESLPWTIDLRQVVEAMNNMSRRLKRLFEEQAKTTEELREQAFKSPVTKLANRRYFDIHFDHLLQEKEHSHTGVALLIEVNQFKAYNDKYGYESGDELLKQVARQIEASLSSFENVLIAHLGGASFAVILQDKVIDVGIEIAHSLSKTFSEFKQKDVAREDDIAHIGLTVFNTNQTKRDILSQLDMALRQAQNVGPNAIHAIKIIDDKQVRGAQDWSKIFDEVVKNNKIKLHFQKLKMRQGTSDLYETLMRVELDKDNIISAGMFMPMAERLNRITELDKCMINLLFEKIENAKISPRYYVNISPSSVDDVDFVKWLIEKIKALGKKANSVIIELPEYGVVHRIDKIRALFLQVSQLGSKTSIDHYGKNFSSFAYLNNLRLDYLKIDGSFVRNIHESDDNQFFIRSLVDIARSLDILVIAETVETDQEYDMLEQLKVDGMQGYYIAKPAQEIS